ncbi:MAG: gamma-glutamylcyclotransferase [Chitinophagaceae bacterium]|nr:gamma-glutamylcyclotransferase [Chitinophagaceae bacterium]
MSNPGTVYPLFVYGSLRSGFRSPAYEYISRYFNFIGEAKVKGRLYDMGSYPAAVPCEDEQYISGELYAIREENEFSWAMAQLDDYEGVNVEADEMQLYKRELAHISLAGQSISAWMYWYSGDVQGRPEIPTGDVIAYMNNK